MVSPQNGDTRGGPPPAPLTTPFLLAKATWWARMEKQYPDKGLNWSGKIRSIPRH